MPRKMAYFRARRKITQKPSESELFGIPDSFGSVSAYITHYKIDPSKKIPDKFYTNTKKIIRNSDREPVFWLRLIEH